MFKVRIKLLAHEATIPGFNDSGTHNVNMAFHDGSLQALTKGFVADLGTKKYGQLLRSQN